MSTTADSKDDWTEWYQEWEREVGQWLEPQQRPQTREDMIQTAWSFHADKMRDELFARVTPLAVHVDFLCRVGDLFSEQTHNCWHETAMRLVDSYNELLQRNAKTKATCGIQDGIATRLGTCCRCQERH